MRTIVCGRWNRHSSERKEARTFWQTRNEYDAGQAGYPALFQAEDSLTKLLVSELDAAGVDYLGDGSFRLDSMYDVARLLTTAKGFSQLTRIPETNHFHRQWREEIGDCVFTKGGQAFLCDFARLRALTKKPLVVCLPGPYSLARQTQNVEERGLECLAMTYALALHEAIDALIRAGAAFVRIEDPQILAHPKDFEMFKKVCRIMTEGLDSSRLALASWYGDVTELRGYFDLPFGMFWLDLVEGKKTLEVLHQVHPSSYIVAGMFDARHTYEESFAEFSATMDAVLRHVPRGNVFVSTNTDLHFLPWDEAMVTVRRMVEYADRYEEGRHGS